MIEVRNISKAFNERPVLQDVSTFFEEGKTNLIIGRSGSGKTVLMKTMIGLLVPDQGDVIYDGQSFHKINKKEKDSIRQEIGMLFQGGALFDSMTVAENVLFPLQMFSSQTKEEMHKRVEFCLERVGLKHAVNLNPSELSGGMKKRVAIARAIANKPKYLFCDEPNSGLDPQTSNMIDQLIHEITKEYNMTTIINTHDMNSVASIGEKIIFIHEGKLWWEGSSNEIRNANNKELAEFTFGLGLMN